MVQFLIIIFLFIWDLTKIKASITTSTEKAKIFFI
jgi:hypothetical protein